MYASKVLKESLFQENEWFDSITGPSMEFPRVNMCEIKSFRELIGNSASNSLVKVKLAYV